MTTEDSEHEMTARYWASRDRISDGDTVPVPCPPNQKPTRRAIQIFAAFLLFSAILAAVIR